MSITVRKVLGNSGSHQSRSRDYIVDGATGEAAALSALLSSLTSELGGSLSLDGIALRGFDYREEDREGCYRITASWGNENNQTDPPATNSFSISFDFATQPQRIVLPINPIKVYGSSGEIENHGVQCIGETGIPGEPPEGCDVMEPSLQWSMTVYKPAAFVDNSYLDQLSKLIGRTNNATFSGFAAGRLLATGVSGSKRSAFDDWELQYRFAARENQTDLVIAGITVAVKKGWDFVWPIRERKIVGSGAEMKAVHTIKRIAVTSPFREADYDLFGIT